MTASGPRRLDALTVELRARLVLASAAGDRDRAAELRGELALLEDLVLPEAVSELRLQRSILAAVERTAARPLPSSLVAFLG